MWGYPNGAPLLPVVEPQCRSPHASFIQAKPIVDKSDDGRHFILESKGNASLFHGEPRVLQRLQHPKCLLEIEVQSGWNRIVVLTHGSSMTNGCDIQVASRKCWDRLNSPVAWSAC